MLYETVLVCHNWLNKYCASPDLLVSPALIGLTYDSIESLAFIKLIWRSASFSNLILYCSIVCLSMLYNFTLLILFQLNFPVLIAFDSVPPQKVNWIVNWEYWIDFGTKRWSTPFLTPSHISRGISRAQPEKKSLINFSTLTVALYLNG